MVSGEVVMQTEALCREGFLTSRAGNAALPVECERSTGLQPGCEQLFHLEKPCSKRVGP